MKTYIAPSIKTMSIGDVMSGFDIVSTPTDAEQLGNETVFDSDAAVPEPKSVWE